MVAEAVRRNIPNLAAARLGKEYEYHSLPLCVIDAVFSIGVRYRNTQKAVDAWCASQTPEWTISRTFAMQRARYVRSGRSETYRDNAPGSHFDIL